MSLPAAVTVIVIGLVLGFTDVIVTVVPLTLAVATPVLLVATNNVPWAPLTVNVPLFGYAIDPLSELIAIGFAALLTEHVNDPVLVV